MLTTAFSYLTKCLRTLQQNDMFPVSQNTPVRRRPPKPELEPDTEDCCSPQMRKRIEPFRERIQTWYDNLPAACASPPKLRLESSTSLVPEGAGNRFSAISEGGETVSVAESSSVCGTNQRGSVVVDEDENYDSFTANEDVSKLVLIRVWMTVFLG